MPRVMSSNPDDMSQNSLKSHLKWNGIHSTFILVWEFWADNFASLLLAVHLLWLWNIHWKWHNWPTLVQPLLRFVQPIVTLLFISSMESNAGCLCDRRKVYALDHNPTKNKIHYLRRNRGHIVVKYWKEKLEILLTCLKDHKNLKQSHQRYQSYPTPYKNSICPIKIILFPFNLIISAPITSYLIPTNLSLRTQS